MYLNIFNNVLLPQLELQLNSPLELPDSFLNEETYNNENELLKIAGLCTYLSASASILGHHHIARELMEKASNLIMELLFYDNHLRNIYELSKVLLMLAYCHLYSHNKKTNYYIQMAISFCNQQIHTLGINNTLISDYKNMMITALYFLFRSQPSDTSNIIEQLQQINTPNSTILSIQLQTIQFLSNIHEDSAVRNSYLLSISSRLDHMKEITERYSSPITRVATVLRYYYLKSAISRAQGDIDSMFTYSMHALERVRDLLHAHKNLVLTYNADSLVSIFRNHLIMNDYDTIKYSATLIRKIENLKDIPKLNHLLTEYNDRLVEFDVMQ